MTFLRGAALLAALFAATGVAAESASTTAPGPITVKALASATQTASGQPIVFPSGDGRAVVSEYTIPPAAALPLHEHPYPRVAYMLQGTLEVTDRDTGQVFLYKPGDVVVEVIGQRHLGRNTGSDPVRLIVFDTLPATVGSNVVLIDK
ncbi:cupin domain-containing protein [Microvirga antarctica]|uniref:cupin domain-containing protein n=1 Tax=Microvirga antarctica TaxID=2819233 RepID=UPI001B313910|nr:cupin domain-containing protein [Microvirga antarctica]